MATSPDTVLMPVADIADRAEAPVTEAGAFRGGRCESCEARSFPQASICPQCNSTDVSATEISGAGSLYSFTTVHVSTTFPTPYTVGYVDLEDGLRVFGQVQVPSADLRCDLPVRVGIDSESPTGWAFHQSEGEQR